MCCTICIWTSCTASTLCCTDCCHGLSCSSNLGQAHGRLHKNTISHGHIWWMQWTLPTNWHGCCCHPYLSKLQLTLCHNFLSLQKLLPVMIMYSQPLSEASETPACIFMNCCTCMCQKNSTRIVSFLR